MKKPEKSLVELFCRNGELPLEAKKLCESSPAVYDANAKIFWLLNSRRHWIPVTESQMRHHIAGNLNLRFRDTVGYVAIVQKWLDVDIALELTGHMAGVHEWRNIRILVTKSPTLIEPVRGRPWLTIEKLTRSMLTRKREWEHFVSWCKLTDQAMRTGNLTKLQSLVLCGPPDAGKSRLQNWIITPVCGNRHVLCYKHIDKEFTAHLFSAEHHMIEDEVFNKDWHHQNALRMYLKNVAANDTADYHRKYGTPLALPTFRRLTLSCNDTEEDMRILPPLDDTMLDKVSLYYCEARPMPMPTATLAERIHFEQRIQAELPGFIAFLQDWKVPPELVGGRDGLVCYHHPKVLELSQRTAPERALFEIICQFFAFVRRWPSCSNNSHDGFWKGTAFQLQSEIQEHLPEAKEILRKLCPHSTSFGSLLARLGERDRDQSCIQRSTIRGQNTYKIEIKLFMNGEFLSVPGGSGGGRDPLPSIRKHIYN
jgi:hypothetical protein